ncbi:hypothetical protein SS50377_27128 [Spironucleus salmonicida]|uniref:Uncharacterized protein n=1 Tax=Spironucleus salmonicida TaxID=348837 RepID=V6LGS5_9EUKA|nr:hypothetical protein SS50377_27128 [Spironucleus salmonicida]|eukprot:EST43745.1 Hypothetical protein SS50377_16477 [Spironucleus salmonicida]
MNKETKAKSGRGSNISLPPLLKQTSQLKSFISVSVSQTIFQRDRMEMLNLELSDDTYYDFDSETIKTLQNFEFL